MSLNIKPEMRKDGYLKPGVPDCILIVVIYLMENQLIFLLL